MSGDDYERVLLVKNEVFVYKIPPLGTNRGYKAAEWKLDNPDWTGRLRIVAIGQNVELRLEDKSTGQLFAKCPVDSYPGDAIEAVTDSSRYFVLRLKNDNGRVAFVGIGFADRGDSFDLNVSLQDHFKYVAQSAKIEQEEQTEAQKPALDLAFKEGQTITVNIGKKSASTSRPRASGAAVGGPVPLLPPPPSMASGSSPRSQRRAAPVQNVQQTGNAGGGLDELLQL